MSGSRVRYLALLGVLGLLGLVTGNAGFYGFFGFLGFLIYRGAIGGAALEANVNRSTRNAFIATTLIFAATISIASLIGGDAGRIFAYGLVASFGSQILVFSVSLAWYERDVRVNADGTKLTIGPG